MKWAVCCLFRIGHVQGSVCVPRVRAAARSASRMSTVQQSDFMPGLPSAHRLYESCQAEIAAFKPGDQPVGPLMAALSLLYARAASVDQVSQALSQAHLRADAEFKRAEKAELELAVFEARTNSKLETRRIAVQCVVTMGYQERCRGTGGGTDPTISDMVMTFARTLLRTKLGGPGKGKPELADEWSKVFVEKTLGMNEADLAEFIDKGLYSAWCASHHVSAVLTTLPGITISDPGDDARLAVAKFLFFCQARRDVAMVSVMRGCAINLHLTAAGSPEKSRLFQYDHNRNAVFEIGSSPRSQPVIMC